MRKAIAYGTVTFALFIANDIYKEYQGERAHFAWTIGLRAAITVLGGLCVLLAVSNRWLITEQRLSVLVAAALLLFGSAQIVFGIIESDTLDPTYSGMVLLVPSIAYAFFRLRFVYALVTTWVLFAEFVLLTAVMRTYDTVHNFVVCVVLLLLANSIHTWYSYWREFYIRRGFLINLKIKREERNHNR